MATRMVARPAPARFGGRRSAAAAIPPERRSAAAASARTEAQPPAPWQDASPPTGGSAAMIAVIFEVEPAEGRLDDYLDHAARLREALMRVPGFVSVERFRSLTNPGKILSLSVWEDEAAVRCWRTDPAHRASQRAGREGIFAGYRLRVAAVLRDYSLTERRDQAPADSNEAFPPVW
jgi:heme-degrading monooxygenase HmoA